MLLTFWVTRLCKSIHSLCLLCIRLCEFFFLIFASKKSSVMYSCERKELDGSCKDCPAVPAVVLTRQRSEALLY